MSGSEASPAAVAAASAGFNIRDAVKAFFYHRRGVTLAAVIPPLASLAVAYSVHTTYVAEARLLVLPGGEYIYRPQVGQQTAESSLNNVQIVQSEMEILSDTALLARALDVLGAATVLPGFKPDASNALAQAVRTVSGDLKIQTAPLTNAINVSFRNRDPVVAAQFTNTLIRLYLQQRPEVYQRSSYATLSEQRDRFSERLRTAETEFATFVNAHQVTNLDEQVTQLLREQADQNQQQRATAAKISAETAQIDQMREQLAHLPRMTVYYAEQTRTAGTDQSSTDMATLQLRRQQMATNYQPDSPILQDMDRQIANLRSQIRRSPARDDAGGRSGPNPLYESLTGQVAAMIADRQGLQAALATAKATGEQIGARLLELNDAGQQYRALKRNRDVLEQTLAAFARNSEEAQLNEALERTREANVRVVQEATPPPTGTSMRKLIVLAGVFMGVVAALATLMVLSGTRQVVIDATDAERRLQLPVLATVWERRRKWPLVPRWGRRASRPARAGA